MVPKYRKIDFCDEREVKLAGHNGVIYVPKRFAGRKAKIVIEKEDSPA